MSGAEPCTGSNIDGKRRSGLMLPLAASPMPPVTAAATSVRMSPNRLSVTITSYRCGCVTRYIAAASTCWYSVDTPSNSDATSAKVRAHSPPAWVSTFDLCTSVTVRRSRVRARANASRTTRSTP